MTTRAEQVALASLTTFKAGGPARYVLSCESEQDLRDAFAFAAEKNLPYYVLGSGSNVLAADAGYDGVVIVPKLRGLSFTETADGVLARAGASVLWDDLVREAAARGLWGVENLAGIPGTAGAAPVQNIGAYGMELSGTLAHVDALDASRRGANVRLSREDCAFGYRDSRFKRERNLVITHVELLLSPSGAPKIEYGDLLRERERGTDLSTPEAIGAAVRTVRAGKFPDLALHGTAGSFFKNPVVSEDEYRALSERFGQVPRFANPNGVKIPLAFILDRVLGLRGFRQGSAWLFGSQPLVLVLDRGGSARDVEALASLVEARVKEATGITIEREVRSMP